MLQIPLESASTERDMRVYGQLVDDETRCSHYHSLLDIIAIRFKCCCKYYPCYLCHQELESHQPIVWSKLEQSEVQDVILCGKCKSPMSVSDYFNSKSKCPKCSSYFNPKCELHYNLYFEI